MRDLIEVCDETEQTILTTSIDEHFFFNNETEQTILTTSIDEHEPYGTTTLLINEIRFSMLTSHRVDILVMITY